MIAVLVELLFAIVMVTVFVRVVVPTCIRHLRESWPAVRSDFTAMRAELEATYTELEAARQLRALERAEAVEPDLVPEVIA